MDYAVYGFSGGVKLGNWSQCESLGSHNLRLPPLEN